MKATLEDNTTGGATLVDVSIKHEGDKTHITFQRKGLNMSLVVGSDDFAHACEEPNDGR